MIKLKTIWDYFEDSVDYPDGVASDPIPYGTVWCYISSTFLNGFINYVEPIKVYQIDRYTAENEIINGKTKAEWRKLVLEGKDQSVHCNLRMFRDDIVILSNIGIGKYMFFYFDMDVSDCCVGRFETDDSEEEVAKSVVNWLEEQKEQNKKHIDIQPNTESGIVGYTELPLSFLRGWLEF